MNRANAPFCKLVLSDGGDRLDGTFSCNGLEESQGTRTLDVLAGSFRCEVD